MGPGDCCFLHSIYEQTKLKRVDDLPRSHSWQVASRQEPGQMLEAWEDAVGTSLLYLSLSHFNGFLKMFLLCFTNGI